MTTDVSIQAALDGLESLLEEFTLPPRTAQTIERLGERLASPVRIAVVGPKGVGKSTLINVLAGEQVIPPGTDLPTTQIQFAPEKMLAVTVADGSRRGFEALDFEAAQALDPLFVEVALPAQRLRRIGLLEIDSDGTEQEMRAAGRWAAKRAEMILWVTRGFDHLEQQLWRQIPESLRDHAFLVMNGIEAYGSTELHDRIKAHENFARGEFLGVKPISAAEAFDALGTEDLEHDLRSSGCRALLDGIFEHIGRGRQADIDAAAMYMQRFGRELVLPDEEGSGIVPPTRRMRGKNTRSLISALSSGADADDETPKVLTKETPAEPVSAQDEVPETATDAPTQAVSKDDEAAAAPNFYLKRFGLVDEDAESPEAADAPLSDAVNKIEACAEDLLRQVAASPKVNTETILQCCLETVEALVDCANTNSALEETVYQASDYLLLLQMEKSSSVAEDAIAALAQMKREFEIAAAA